MLHHLPVSHSIFHLTAPARVRHEVAAAPYPVMGTPTKARKSKAGTLPEDSKVRDLLGTGREKRTHDLSDPRQRCCFAFLGLVGGLVGG